MFDDAQIEARQTTVSQLIEREIERTNSAPRTVDWTTPRGEGIILHVPATVYPPREDTTLLASALDSITSGRPLDLLEIGCGSGAVSLFAQRRGWNVVACDINPFAVAATRGLAETYGAEHMEVIEGGIESDSGFETRLRTCGPYDVIAWNLPYLERPAEGQRLGPLEEAALSQSTIEEERPLETSLRLALEMNPEILRPSGVVLLVHNDRLGGRIITSQWREQGWASREVGSAIQTDGERLIATALWKPWHRASIVHEESLESTNLQLLESDSIIGTLLTCAHQTAGRGQRERQWEQFESGWAGSWVIDPRVSAGLAQLAAGVAVCEAAAAIEGRVIPSFDMAADGASSLVLKWPNDVLFEGRKVCGVLAQARTRADDVRMVLGIGTNLGHVSEEQSERVGGAAGLAQALGSDMDQDQWSTVLHACIASWFEDHELLGASDLHACIRTWWTLAANHLGGYAPTLDGIEFRLTGLDSDGAVRLCNSEERLDSAESTFESFKMRWLD